MELEIPSALIHDIQLTLRREAGVPSYDPTDPSLPALPTLYDAISALDPSLPPDLRCGRCGGTLLRGPGSIVCIFCGADRRREAPPQRISFNSTAGCWKLLDFLGLDGSEAVILDSESGDSSKGQDLTKEDMILSGLLDLELRWPLEKEEIDINDTNKVPPHLPFRKEEIDKISTNKVLSQSSYALNLSGVDLDTFFSDTKEEETSTADSLSSEQLIPKNQIKSTDSDVSSGSQNFGFSANFQLSGMAVTSINTKDGEFGDSFDDWQADFQSASSEIFAVESKSIDLFQGSSTAELPRTASVTNTFSHKNEIEHGISIKGSSGEPRNDEVQLFSDGNWIKDDHLSQMNRGMVNTADQFKSISETNNAELKNDLNYTSVSDRLAQDDVRPTSRTQELNNAKNVEDNDSFNDWQDLTSSGGAQGGLSNSLVQNITEASSTKELGNTKNSDGNGGFDAWQEFNNSKTIEDNDDLLDDWQDFTSSGGTQGGLSNSSAQNGIEATSTKTPPNTKNINDTDDFDAWQDFTTFVEAPADLSNSWAKNSTKATTSEHVLGTKSVNLQDMGFGSFLHSDSLTETLEDSKGYREANSMQLDPSVSDRINGTNGEIGEDSIRWEATEIGEKFTAAANLEPSKSKVEKLLLQMHDLSFMLENSLSIPEKLDGSDLNS